MVLGDVESTAWVLRIGGVSALVATYMIMSMLRSEDGDVEESLSVPERDVLLQNDEDDETTDLFSSPIEERGDSVTPLQESP